MWKRVNPSPCGLEARDALLCPSAFPGGEDSLTNFFKCGGECGFVGTQVTTTKRISASSADYPAQVGGVDPIVWLGGQPVLQYYSQPRPANERFFS